MEKMLKNLIAIICLVSGLLACNKVKNVERTESKDEAKVSLQFPEAKNQGLEVLYHVKLHLEGWPSPCSGKATLRVAPDFKISFPSNEANTLSCFGFLEFSLSELLGGITNSAYNPSSNGESRIAHDGYMLYLKRLSKADFNPPRPFLLGPVITDLDKYKGFHKVTETTATVNKESFEGRFIVDVHEIGTSYQKSCKS